MISVVNLHKKDYNIYIGRGSPWGNPWSHKQGTKALFVVDSPEIAVDNYEQWLRGKNFTNILQKERQWILNHLGDLINMKLGCFCKPNICHGDVLKKLAEEYYEQSISTRI